MMGTGSSFAAASVFAFAFSAKPTSVWIVNTFESVFALCSPLFVFDSLGGGYVDVG